VLAGDVEPGESSMEYLAQQQGISIDRITGMNRSLNWWNDFASFIRVSSFLRREHPDVVHTHTAKAGALGRVAAFFARVPVRVHMFHGHVFCGYFSRFITRIFIAVERFLAKFTDRLIALSTTQKHDLSDVFAIAPAEKIVTLPLGFNLTPYLETKTRTNGFRASIPCCPQDAPLIGWIGRLTPIKSPQLFIDAAKLIHEHEPEARFVMIGDGELAPLCRARIQASGVSNHFTLTGSLRNLEEIYPELNLLVLTSVNEGTPFVLLEAMASARPFVAVDVGGIRDLMAGVPTRVQDFRVFDNGILVPRTAASIASAVRYLIGSPALTENMGQAGRDFACQRFSAERMVDDLENLYQKLLSSKGKLSERATPATSLSSHP
jgi:glycosyltransferase involved in cell wall biosynthesis